MATARAKTGLKRRDVSKDHFSSGKSTVQPNFSRLVITFIEGKDLLVSDVETGKSDPVCFVWCGPVDQAPDLATADDPSSGILKTNVCPTTVDPIWNEDVVFPLETSDINSLADLKLSIYVRDEDISPSGGEISYDELGMLDITFHDIITKGKTLKSGIVLSSAWYTLTKSPGMRRVDGKIKLTINLVIAKDDFTSMSTQVGAENQPSLSVMKKFQNIHKSSESPYGSDKESSLRSSYGSDKYPPRQSSVSPTRPMSANRMSTSSLMDSGSSINSARPGSARSTNRDKGVKNISTAPLVRLSRPSTAPNISSIPEDPSSQGGSGRRRYDSYGGDSDDDDLNESQNPFDDVNMETITKNNNHQQQQQNQQQQGLLVRPAFKNVHVESSDDEEEEEEEDEEDVHNDDFDENASEDELVVIGSEKKQSRKQSAKKKEKKEKVLEDSGTFTYIDPNKTNRKDSASSSRRMDHSGAIPEEGNYNDGEYGDENGESAEFNFGGPQGGDEGMMEDVIKLGISTATGLGKQAANELQLQNILLNVAQAVAEKVTDAKSVTQSIQNGVNIPSINLNMTAPANMMKSLAGSALDEINKLTPHAEKMVKSIASEAGKHTATLVDTIGRTSPRLEKVVVGQVDIGGITAGTAMLAAAQINKSVNKEKDDQAQKETKRKTVEKTLIPPKSGESDAEGSELDVKDIKNSSRSHIAVDKIQTVIPSVVQVASNPVAPSKPKPFDDTMTDISPRPALRIQAVQESIEPPQARLPIKVAAKKDNITSTSITSLPATSTAKGLNTKLDKLLATGPAAGDNAIDPLADLDEEPGVPPLNLTLLNKPGVSIDSINSAPPSQSKPSKKSSKSQRQQQQQRKVETDKESEEESDVFEEVQQNRRSTSSLAANDRPSSATGSTTSVVRALKEMGQQRVAMEKSIQELTRITQDGLLSLSDRITKMEQNQLKGGAKGVLDSGPGGGDEADAPEDLRISTSGKLSKSSSTASAAEKAKTNTKAKLSGLAAFKRDQLAAKEKKSKVGTASYAAAFGATDREPVSRSPTRQSSQAKFEPEIALVYRGTDGRIATNRVQSPDKNGGNGQYEQSYDRPSSPQRPQPSNQQQQQQGYDGYNPNNNNNYNNNQGYSANNNNGNYNQQPPQPPLLSGVNALRNSFQQQNGGGVVAPIHQQGGAGFDPKSTVNRDFCEVLDRGSLEDVAQLMECTGPRPELLSSSTRNRLYDAIATLLYQNSKHSERCLIWVLALVRGKDNLLATMVNHSKKDLIEALEKLAVEPSKRGLLASLLKSQIHKQLKGL